MTGAEQETHVMDHDARTAELAQRLSAVRQRILDAAQQRSQERSHRGELPSLIVVTKFFPAQDVVRLRDLGVRAVGENKDQEALPKAGQVSELLDTREDTVTQPSWHFIGQLQSNKAKRVVRYASWVHSVDRGSLVTALEKAVVNHRSAVENGEATPGPCARADLKCCIQVNLDPEAERDTPRGGTHPSQVAQLGEHIANSSGLELAGVMAVAPRAGSPAEAFERLWEISQQLQRDHPAAAVISAGMSGDLEAAIACGATHVRIGSDVLGPRPTVR